MSTQIIVERKFMVPMRDGIGLATDIYRPADDEKHPVLIFPNPYSRNNAVVVGGYLTNPMLLVDQGYVVVVPESRGRGGSEGIWRPWITDGQDGYDAVEWAAAQPWSNGAVGAYGNCGHVYPTLALACAAPPHLKAILLYMGGVNPHDGWTYSSGALELGFNLFWALSLAPDTVSRLDPETRAEAGPLLMRDFGNLREAMHHLPLRDVAGAQNGAAPYWVDWTSHPTYDEFWQEVDLLRQVDKIEVPILHISGWYDLMLKGHLDLNRALNTVGDPKLREHHRFILGPWDHEAYLSSLRYSTAGHRNFGLMNSTGPSLMAPLISKWFGKWLRGEDTDVLGSGSGSKTRYFTLGENTWRETADWPPPHKLTDYHLHSTGRANTSKGDGALSTDAAPGEEAADAYVYDPLNPVPTRGGRTLMGLRGGIEDQAGVEEREDVLVYTSAPLLSPLTIAGPVTVKLYASSSAPDTDFTAKLVDVELGGYCMNVTEGIIRARYRDGVDKEVFLNPGEVTEFTIDLWDVAHMFKAGHRIRLEISSSNFPRFDRNLNSKVPPEQGSAADIEKAMQRVFHGQSYPSRIILPVASQSLVESAPGVSQQ